MAQPYNIKCRLWLALIVRSIDGTKSYRQLTHALSRQINIRDQSAGLNASDTKAVVVGPLSKPQTTITYS